MDWEFLTRIPQLVEMTVGEGLLSVLEVCLRDLMSAASAGRMRNFQLMVPRAVAIAKVVPSAVSAVARQAHDW